jgi:hypothetical protein
MKDRVLPRKPVVLSESTQRRLGMYALAATAGGIGTGAFCSPAEAKVVYTPTHHVIRGNSYFAVDLNHDRIWDFSIINSAYRVSHTSVNFVGAKGNDSVYGGVAGAFRSPDTFSALALKRGARIAGAQRFYSRGVMAGQCANNTGISTFPCSGLSHNTAGKWVNVNDRYLGLSFTIHGKNHYGWARLNVKVSKDKFRITAILTGYAYETVPNKPIIAGKTKGQDVITMPMDTGTVGHLALGRK